MHRLASTVSTGAVLSTLMTITGSAHAGFQLIEGYNVPLINDGSEEEPGGVPVAGYWYGPSPCINDSLDGSYFIGFNRYTPVDDDDFDKEFCGDDSQGILNELRVMQNDGTIYPIGIGHHPVLTDDTPLILYWETEGSTWIDPTLDPDSRGNGCNLGTSYEEDPDKNASCQFTDTVGMPTLDAELGRSLVLASDGSDGALVLKQPGCLDMPVILTEEPDTLDQDATYTRHLPRISVISDSTAVFLVHWKMNGPSSEVVSGLYSIELNDVSGKKVASASLRAFTGMEFSVGRPTEITYRITVIGLPDADGIDSGILRTISVNDNGLIVFRCSMEYASSPRGQETDDLYNFGDAILSLSPQDNVSVITYDMECFAGLELCSERCSSASSSGDQFHPVINSFGDVAFTASAGVCGNGGGSSSLRGTQGILVKRHVFGLNTSPTRDLVVIESNGVDGDNEDLFIHFKETTPLSNQTIRQLGKSIAGFPDSPHLPFAMSSYGDIAVYCRLDTEADDEDGEYTDDLILIFDRKSEVLAWVQEGDGLKAHVWDDQAGAYIEHELVAPDTFDCDPDSNYWYFGELNHYSFLRVKVGNLVTTLEGAPPFSFARGSGGEDGRARAFGNYGQTTSCWHVPERSFVFAGDVAVHLDPTLPSFQRPCTSGIFEIRLPALSDDENWESCTPGDFNNDGVVDGSDFSVILINFRATGCNIADIASVGSPTIWEPDGVVDFTDFSAFLVAYGKECR